MAILRTVSPAPEEVTIPASFSVTGALRAMSCLLWGTLSSLPKDSATLFRLFALPPSPEAILGSLLHKLDDNAAKGLIEVPSDADPHPFLAACRGAFRELVKEKEKELSANKDLSAFVPLDRSVPFDVFSRRKAAGLRRAAETLQRYAQKKTDTGAPRQQHGGSEEWFESGALRLRGRLDRWRTEADGTTILEDLKTGHVTDDALVQLQLYALLLREKIDAQKILLRIVAQDDDFEAWFSSADAGAMKGRLDGVMKQVPAHSSRKLSDLATPGGHCVHCEHRPLCASYHTYASSQWTNATEAASAQRLPFDTWGEIKEVQKTGSLRRIVLVDIVGRKVVLERVSLEATDVLEQGEELFAYELSPVGGGALAGAPSHPCSFREMPTSLGGRRAVRAILLKHSVTPA